MDLKYLYPFYLNIIIENMIFSIVQIAVYSNFIYSNNDMILSL